MQLKTELQIVYHARIIKVSICGSEIVGFCDSQASVGNGVEDLIVEDVVIIEEGAEDKIEQQIIAHIEVSSQVAHVIEGFDKIEFADLNHFEHQQNDYVIQLLLIMMRPKTTQI